MFNNYQNQVGSPQPMNPQDYNAALERAIQQDTLNHPEKIMNHRLALERDTHKSCLRTKERYMKQQMKNRIPTFSCRENSIWLQIINGANVLIFQQSVFCCRIEQVKRYQRDGLDEIFWQLVLVEEKSGQKVYSPLYGSEILQSYSKLRKTILLKYQNIGDTKNNSLSWVWMQRHLMEMIETSEIIKLPSKAGWFEREDSWHFWVANTSDIVLLNEPIRKCYTDEFSELHSKDLVSDFLNLAKDGCMGELFLVRLCSVFGRLIGELPMKLGVAIVGKQSKEIAVAFLRTMHNDDNVDIINLDTDRIGKIQDRVQLLQDTPVLMVSSDPDSRSTQNRIQRVMGWFHSGYVEGAEVRVPFIFCLRKFSKLYPLDDLVLLDADEIQISTENVEIFSKCQCFLVQKVQRSGDHLVQKFKRNYAENRAEFQNESKAISLVWAVIDTVLDIFKEELDEASYEELEDLLYFAGNKIYDQLAAEDGEHVLVEIFQKKVKYLADEGTIYFADRKCISSVISDNVVFYDDEHYFFIKGVLQFVCEQAEIDYKSLLFIKQQLAEQEMLKLYANRGGYGRDLEVDFLAYDINRDHKKLSGLAIKRQFWDKIGGISLAERNGYDGITL